MDASEPRNLAPDLQRALTRRGWRGRLERLRGLTPLEYAHHALRFVQAHLERRRAPPEPPPADLGATFRPWLHLSRAGARACIAAAERVRAGWLDVHALRDLDFGMPPRWNRDPKTGIEAPLRFGKLLDTGDADLVGEIGYLWQPNRHGHLVTLARAYALTRDAKYFAALAEQLDSWFIACPPGRGPNWASAHEAALRLINWSGAWQLLGGAHSPAFAKSDGLRERWLDSVLRHAEFVRGWLSLHSLAGHRLIGEAAGLYLAALTWPHWSAARGWLATGRALLEREALAQTAPDGVHREQSLASQQEALELLLLCMLAAKANGQGFSPAYESRVETMLDFLASIMDAGGNVPLIGDADGGAGCRSLLATGALVYGRGDFKLKARRLDERSRWLFGEQADARFAALDAERTRLPLRQAFHDGGYFVLGCAVDTPGEVRIVADAGPLGYGSNAERGHADALAFTLSAGGEEFLVDPGSCALQTQPRWRDYFRGTSAHNTLRVDGADQSLALGGGWATKARARCSLWLSSAEKDTFEGWHDGYRRLEDPVTHRRLIELDKRRRVVVVEDTLEMELAHAVELFFHCAEGCTVEPAADGYTITRGARVIALRLPAVEGATSAVYRGSMRPMLGWISRELDRPQPAPTIVWRGQLVGRAVLRTEIAVPAGG